MQPLITYLWKLKFEFFIEQLVPATAVQFGNFNMKCKYLFWCLTSTLTKWNMYRVFSEGFFTSDKQIFYVIKFLSAMTSQRNFSCTYSLKSQVVGLEMFLKELYRVQHEFENKGNLKIIACNDLYLTKKV